jgi:hypothetical protein
MQHGRLAHAEEEEEEEAEEEIRLLLSVESV